MEYVPFGEVFIEERNNTWNTPYLFNGKELDEETGLYYYGARYYNPRVSQWLSVDPLAEKYPSISPYVYVANNPINAIDPDGRIIIFINGMHTGDGGNRSYWNGLDNRIMNRIGDRRRWYYDGSVGGHKNIKYNKIRRYRTLAGFEAGKAHAANLYSSLEEGETIKIVTHSMGGAYGKGYAQALKNYARDNNIDGHKIELVLDLANYQSSDQKAVSDTNNIQIMHEADEVAGIAPLEGADRNIIERRGEDKWYKFNGVSEHSVDSFSQEEINEHVPTGKISGNSSKNTIWEEKPQNKNGN